MRNFRSDALGKEIQAEWERFTGTKEQFMAQLSGVTSDQRVEPAVAYTWLKRQRTVYYYCTVIRGGRLYEVFSYDDEEWSAKC